MNNLSQVEAAFLKADAAGDIPAATALAGEVRRLRSTDYNQELSQLDKAKPDSENAKFREQNPALNKLFDFAKGATTTGRGGINLLNKIAPNSIAPFPAESRLTTPGGSAAQIAGSVLDPGALMLGGAISKALPYTQIFNSAATATRPAVQGAGVLAGGFKNAFGGAAMGAPLGLLSAAAENQDLVSGTGFGAGAGAVANMILPPMIKGVGTGVGKATDLLMGKYGDVNASRILNQVTGTGAAGAEARRLAAAAPPNLTAAQALEPANNDMIRAFGDMVAKNDATNFYQRTAASQAANRENIIGILAGGGNQTAAKQSQEEAARLLRGQTIPKMNAVLSAANTAGTTGRVLQSEADRFGNAAASKVEDVRRMSALGQTADDLANTVGTPNLNRAAAPPTNIGEPRISGRYGYGTDLAQRAEASAQQAADASLPLGEAARFARYKADSIAAHGLKPVDTTPIERSLLADINSPGIRANDVQRNVLQAVLDKLKEAKSLNNGIVDARDLHEIRKSGVNQIIEKMLAGVDPKAQNRYAADLLDRVKPLIDKAIDKAAGGDGSWKSFLNEYAAGMHQIDQQKMFGVLLGKLKDSPSGFEKIVRGDDPKTVRKIFDTGYDITQELGNKFPAVKSVAEELSRDRSIQDGASRGAIKFKGILDDNFSKFHLPNWISGKVAVTNRVLGEVEARINKRAADALQEAGKSGKSYLEALNFLPADERIEVIKLLSKSDPFVKSGLLSGSNNIRGLLQQGEQ